METSTSSMSTGARNRFASVMRPERVQQGERAGNSTLSRPTTAAASPNASPSTSPNTLPSGVSAQAVLPVNELLDSGIGTIDMLSNTLSFAQISHMEATLQRIKMKKLSQQGQQQRHPQERDASTESEAAQLTSARRHGSPGPSQTPRRMQHFLSVISPAPKYTAPTAPAPLIQMRDGVPWLSFTYSTKSSSTAFEIRANIDSIADLATSIPSPDFRVSNCLYPSADGPEDAYKGAGGPRRREYERECNEQGWRLAYLNLEVLSGKKGLLQRAVVSLRNATAEQKSRRIKRHEKREAAAQAPRQSKAVHQGRVLRGELKAIPRLLQQQPQQRGHGGALGSHPQSPKTPLRSQPSLSWQPPLVSTLHHPHLQPPNPGNLIPSHVPQVVPQPLLAVYGTTNHPIGHPSTFGQNQPPWIQKLPSLGSFQSSSDPSHFLEFDGYVGGQFRKVRILHNGIHRVEVDNLPIDFRKANCVYPRSFIPGGGVNGSNKTSEAYEDEPSQSQQWKVVGVRQAEEAYLNEIGWKLCSLNHAILGGKRLLLQRALDAYRRRFLHATCQPRARVGPSLLTRRASLSNIAGSSSAGSERLENHHHQNSRRWRPEEEQRRRVRFHDQEITQRHVHTHSRRLSHAGESVDYSSGEEDGNLDEKEDDDEDEIDTDEQHDSSSEEDDDESEDGSSSDGGGEFHSQMSLLSFTGSIRTYSLGTGSGSARSRPRIKPAVVQRHASRLSPTLPPLSKIHVRKRSVPEQEYGQRDRVQLVEGSPSWKKTRPSDSREDMRCSQIGVDEVEDSMETNVRHGRDVDEHISEEQDTGQDQDQMQEEDDWWMSRLQNSEYPEDHNFVSMTTEELIGALTSGYNSDVDDDEDEEDEESDQ